MTTLREFIASRPDKMLEHAIPCQAEIDQRAADLREWVANLPAHEAIAIFDTLSNPQKIPLILADPNALAMAIGLADVKFVELFVSLMQEVQAENAAK